MRPEEIDKAIDALPDHELEALYDAAAQRWSSRAQNWALPVAVLAIMLTLFVVLRESIQENWPESPLASTLATLFWCSVLFGLLRFTLSVRVTKWRTRWAARREYRSRSGAA